MGVSPTFAVAVFGGLHFRSSGKSLRAEAVFKILTVILPSLLSPDAVVSFSALHVDLKMPVQFIVSTCSNHGSGILFSPRHVTAQCAIVNEVLLQLEVPNCTILGRTFHLQPTSWSQFTLQPLPKLCHYSSCSYYQHGRRTPSNPGWAR